MAQQYGDIVRIRLILWTAYLFDHPNGIKHVLNQAMGNHTPSAWNAGVDLANPTYGATCSLFPSPTQVLPLIVPPSSSSLVLFLWDRQCTMNHLHRVAERLKPISILHTLMHTEQWLNWTRF